MSHGEVALRERIPANREELQTALDAAVRENRFTIAVFFPAVGAVTLVASAEGLLPEPLAFNAWLLLFGVVVMRSPLIVGVLPVMDRRAFVGFGLLTAYTYAVEVVGVSTGVPYGDFSYGVSLGPMVGGVPVALPVFFIPLVVNAYLLCLLLLGERASSRTVRIGVVIPTVVVMDLVLDPGAVALGFWSFAEGGVFYGVPLSNYAGWTVSAVVTVVLLDASFDREALLARLRSCDFMLDDMVSFVILWGVINIWFWNAVPVLVAVAFGVGLVRADSFDAGLFDPR
ncbi:MAG: bisanhydrobacterioruberin hydratase [Halobacteriales archaeon]|nr:bisanhydrobacterioruberin hydratase [Halobacteriales archaeon]